jgi:hypothetical protein
MKQNKISVLIPDGESRHALPVLKCLSQVSNLKINILSAKPWTEVRFSAHRASYQRYK